MRSKLLTRREWLKQVAVAGVAPLVPGVAVSAAAADGSGGAVAVGLSGAAGLGAVGQAPGAGGLVVGGAGVHRILTCNILLDLPEQRGTPEDWEVVRRAACMQVIGSRRPDIVCLQEVGRGQNEDFVRAFEGFEVFGYADPYVDRYPPRFQSCKNVILFSRERYAQTGAGIYWLSPTPLIAGSRLRPTKLPRHVTWLRLRDRVTGVEFRVLNTHFALEQPVRVEEARILTAEAAQYAEDFPQLLAGDLNSHTTSEEHMVLTDGCFEDTFAAVHGAVENAAEPGTPAGHPKIDFIMGRGKVKAAAAEIIRDRPDGHAPSDHYFVSADVELG